MADIINTDNGSVAAGKANDKLGTSIGVGDSGSAWVSKVNVFGTDVTYADSGSQFAAKVNDVSPIGTTLRVMTLNVGHYADGNASSPSFNADTYASYVAKFTAFIQAIDADIICVQEYSANVYQSNAAKDVLFGDYPYSQIGTISGYLGNAVFSKVPLTFVKQQTFAQSNSSGRYYQLLELEIGGKTIGLINAHLDTTSRGNNYRNSQFGEIVGALKDYDYAIYGSDSNVARVQDDGIGGAQWEVINYWVNGGTYNIGNYPTLDCGSGYGGGDYTLASKVNGDYIGTWPTTRWAASSANSSHYAAMSCPCDNIAVKGFSVTNPTKVDSTDVPVNDITDHCAFYCDLTLMNLESGLLDQNS